MLSIYLASVIGWYLLIVGAFILVRTDYVKLIMADILAQRALVFIIAIVTLIFGLMLVATHNIWIMGWPVIITLFGWGAVLSAILRLFFPEIVIKL